MTRAGRAVAIALRSLVIAAALVLIPSVLVSRSVLHRDDVPWLLRSGGLFVEWAITAVVLLPAFVLLARSRRTATSQIMATALIALSITWLTLSWGLFYGSGQFLSAEAIAFASDNGSQLLKHFFEFNPVVTATIPVILGMATFAVLLLGKRPYPANRQRSNLVSLGAIALLGAGLLTLRWTTLRSVSSLSTNSTTGAVDLTSNKWRRYLAKEVGPLSSFATRQLNEVTGDGELWPTPRLALPEYRRDRITIEQYLAQVPSDAKRYNVLLILIESLRNDVLTILGGTRTVMPHLEALASDSLVMTRAYANATLSAYADPSAVSSQHPLRSWNYRSYPDPVPYPRVLLWDLLAPRGYATAIISSQNEHWGGMLNFLHTPSLGYVFHGETFHQSYIPNGEAGFAEWAAQFKRSGKVDDADTTSELIRYVRETKQPFVVYANFQNSHFPYRFPEPGPFQPSQVDFRYTFFDFPRDKIDTVKNRYHNALHFIDAQLGRLFTALKEIGAWDNTIIAIAGDNGEAFLEHGVAGHGTTPYEELIRVPVVIHAPGLDARVSDRLSQHLDLVPTIVSLLGMPAHPAFQGASMLPGEKPPTPIFSVVQIPTIRELAVIDGTWKLIADGETKREVYDLATDPAEKNNLWGTDGKRDERLFNLLLSFRKLQLSYYSDPARWTDEYVPSLSP